MLEALVGGEIGPEMMAALARGRLRNKHDPLIEALEGRTSPHQRFLLAALLRHLDAID
jgi:hypothetical protein